MQRTQSWLSISRHCASSSLTRETCAGGASPLLFLRRMALVGQRVSTLSISSSAPCAAYHSRASFSSVRMLSRQVPMVAMSERWIELTQSFGQPENLNLNLYGSDGRCISSRLELITSRSARCSS